MCPVIKIHVGIYGDVIALAVVIDKTPMFITDTEGHYQNLQEVKTESR